MADWDDEEYVPNDIKPITGTDQWSGEDEDDDVKDNWEDSDDGEAKHAAAPASKEKKKPLKERIAEREAKRKADLEEKRRKEEELRLQMTPEEVAAEKERLKLQEEEEQLMLAKELMGVSVAPVSGIDAMKPKTPEEFTEFANKLKTKISESETHLLYPKFLEDLFRDLCATASLNAESTKKIGSAITTLGNEKQKLEKAVGGKGKKGKKGATIKQVRTNDYDEGEYDNEFEDFM